MMTTELNSFVYERDALWFTSPFSVAAWLSCYALVSWIVPWIIGRSKQTSSALAGVPRESWKRLLGFHNAFLCVLSVVMCTGLLYRWAIFIPWHTTPPFFFFSSSVFFCFLLLILLCKVRSLMCCDLVSLISSVIMIGRTPNCTEVPFISGCTCSIWGRHSPLPSPLCTAEHSFFPFQWQQNLGVSRHRYLGCARRRATIFFARVSSYLDHVTVLVG